MKNIVKCYKDFFEYFNALEHNPIIVKIRLIPNPNYFFIGPNTDDSSKKRVNMTANEWQALTSIPHIL